MCRFPLRGYDLCCQARGFGLPLFFLGLASPRTAGSRALLLYPTIVIVGVLGGSQREAALPRLVELLRQAEATHAQEGWTTLNSAMAFIKTLAPHETPKKHTFGSWRQVLHVSRAFEVRRRPAAPGEAVETLYRYRN